MEADPGLMVFAVAFASRLARSKPSHVSMQEYLAKIRDLDPAIVRMKLLPGFKDPYTGQSMPLAEQYELELVAKNEQIDRLREQNRLLEEVIAAHCQKTNTVPDMTPAPLAQIPEVLETYRTFLSNVMMTYHLMNQQPLNTKAIGHAAVNIVTSITQVLTIPGAKQFTLDKDPCPWPDRDIRSCYRGVCNVYRALEHLHKHDETMCAPVVYALVEMFRTMLAHIWRRPPQVNELSEEHLIAHKDRITRFTSFMFRLVRHLDPDLPPHRKVFEGYLAMFYDHLGRVQAHESRIEAFVQDYENLDIDTHPITASFITQFTTWSMLKLEHEFLEYASMFITFDHTTAPHGMHQFMLRDRLHRSLMNSLYAYWPELENILKECPILEAPPRRIAEAVPLPPMPKGQEEIWHMIGMDFLAQ